MQQEKLLKESHPIFFNNCETCRFGERREKVD